MHRTARCLLLAACLIAAIAHPSRAATPSTMSYQGVLTDGGGNLVPDASYSLTFRIYDAAVAGTLLWTENHPAVPVTKGGFSVVLGSIDDLNLTFDATYYLGVSVGANPELSPRVELTSAPSAMSVWMRGTGNTATGELSWYPAGLGDGGGYLHLFSDGFGGHAVTIEPDFGGGAAWAYFSGAGGGLNWDGNAGSGGVLSLTGPTSSMTFSTEDAGNASVILPGNAIAAGEILDEPGIAQGHAIGQINIPAGGTMTDLVTVSITTPAAGYIVIHANAQHGLGGNGTSLNYASLQIDETAGGGTDANHYFASGFSPTSNHFTWNPVSLMRTYNKPAGTYTFRVEGAAANPGSLDNYLWNPTITATFYPTAYGTVTTAATGPELAQFSEVTHTVSGPNGPGSTAGGAGALVDLRELELRARRDEARAAESRRLLMEARLKQQQEAGMKARAARSGAIGAAAPVAAPKEER